MHENHTLKHMNAYFEKKEREEKDGTKFAKQKEFGKKIARASLAIAEVEAKYRSDFGLSERNKYFAAKAEEIRKWLERK